jgi:hypothetical protein
VSERGFTFIESSGSVQAPFRVPGFCPICGGLMRGNSSTRTWYDWGCCIGCFIQFIEGREPRWKSGWRPSQEEVKAYIDTNWGTRP